MIVFSRNGYSGTRLTDVADVANISHGTIYNYYQSKEDLFRALFKSRFTEQVNPMPSPELFNVSSSVEMLKVAMIFAFRQLADSDSVSLLRILLVESERFPDLVNELMAEIFGKAEFILKIFVQQGVGRGELRDGEYRNHLTLMLAPVLTSVLFGPLGKSPDWKSNAERTLEAFFDMIEHGISARP